MKTLTVEPGEFEYARVVQFSETDLAGIVHFSAYFRYMEEAEHALWRAAGLSVARDDLHWPRVSASCEYASPLRFEDESKYAPVLDGAASSTDSRFAAMVPLQRPVR
jgi:acyl-CoA thioesterase FadM